MIASKSLLIKKNKKWKAQRKPSRLAVPGLGPPPTPPQSCYIYDLQASWNNLVEIREWWCCEMG